MHLIEKLEREKMNRPTPPVRVGDTVEVHYLIREGDKERVQLFIGTIIAIPIELWVFQDRIDQLLSIFRIKPEDVVDPVAQYPLLDRAVVAVVGHTHHHRIFRSDLSMAKPTVGVDGQILNRSRNCRIRLRYAPLTGQTRLPATLVQLSDESFRYGFSGCPFRQIEITGGAQ